MFCTNCGQQIEDGSAFCPYCGMKQDLLDMEEPAAFSAYGQTSSGQAAAFSAAQAQAYRVSGSQAVSSRAATAKPEPVHLGAYADDGVRHGSSFYIFDFFSRLFRKSNITSIIYMVLNLCLISLMFGMFAGPYGLIIGPVVYLLSLTLALSPVGEWMVRRQTGCKEIKDQVILEKVKPVFDEVYAQARQSDASINPNVKLFMNDDTSVNAFATGRRTVCVTRGFASIPEDQMKAILGHEFGHLAHKDTDMLQVICVGNAMVTILFTIIRFIILFLKGMMDVVAAGSGIFGGGLSGLLGRFASWLSDLMITLILDALMALWTWIGMALCRKSRRGNEYEADAFSYRLGYGNGLISFFQTIVHYDVKPKGLFAVISQTHPATADRIAHLQALDADRHMLTG